ncbi:MULTISPECIES: hypothetical protein [unclassified Streptomyces]|uniref:hypothetical protein n=1 Tax=unclassified Streptomyces TaxID=2593676 RepID=UPI0036EDC8F5
MTSSVTAGRALLVQRGHQAERHLADVEQRVDAVERSRWPLPSVAAAAGVGGLALSIYQLAAL